MPLFHRRFWLLVVLLAQAVALLPLFSRAADDDAPAGRQYALLVGVRNYSKDQLRSLKYTEADVNDLAAVLKEAGYKRVVLMTQTEAAAQNDNDLLPTAKNVRRQLTAILDARKPGDSVLVAFSGHGVQFRDQKASFFCPMDADLADMKTLVALAEVYKGLEDCPAGTKALLVDACRNDPQAEASKAVDKIQLESVTRPQAERPPGGVAALFSCSAGQRSYESEKLGHGVFFHYVIEGLRGEAANKKGEVGLQGLAAYVTDEVPDAVKDVSLDARQQPQLVGDLSGAAPLVAVALKKEIANSLGMKLVLIPPGTFTMGSPKGEEGRDVVFDESQHEVTITRPFYMGVFPVTQGEYQQLIHKDPSEFSKDGKGKDQVKDLDTTRFPVESVTRSDAVEFCDALSKADAKKPAGWSYDLPTEAEWEYACRAGTKTAYSFGNDPRQLDDYAWHAGNAGDRTHEVGTRKPNPWGLYDMHGNVWQWCADHYGEYQKGPVTDPSGPDGMGDNYIVRGGSWGVTAPFCRSARRETQDDDDDSPYISYCGFRVVLRAAAKAP